jgi:hypothetical protein
MSRLYLILLVKLVATITMIPHKICAAPAILHVTHARVDFRQIVSSVIRDPIMIQFRTPVVHIFMIPF